MTALWSPPLLSLGYTESQFPYAPQYFSALPSQGLSNFLAYAPYWRALSFYTLDLIAGIEFNPTYGCYVCVCVPTTRMPNCRL